jgi:hypothetical protein
MANTIAEIYRQLRPDEARKQLGFSPEMQSTHEKIFRSASVEDICNALAEWLHRFQPCLFGRLGARAGLIQFCILNEADLLDSDEWIRDKIQDARLQWTREGYEGRKSAFVVLANSEKLIGAAPDYILQRFAQRLCSLYLLQEIELDTIYTDEIFLEKPGTQRTTWKWLAGVNVFSANADRRWWQDHRIPGGIGFSVNSVGHMVKAGIISKVLRDLDALLGVPSEPLITTKIDSLEKALEFAMRTIWGASEAISGKATELLPLPSSPGTLAASKCPVELPKFLSDKDYCEYRGYYHTDITLPSDYFRPEVVRPEEIKPQSLDFTYLFREHVDNPAHHTMGKGRRVRGEDSDDLFQPMKYRRAEPQEIAVESSRQLMRALGS